MRSSSCWVSITLTDVNAAKLTTMEHWLLESRRGNRDLLDDAGLEGGYLKVAELFALVGFKCVSVRKEGKGLNLLFAWDAERNGGHFFPIKEGYSVLTLLTGKAKAKAKGILLEEGSSLHWFYPSDNREGVIFKQVYTSNIDNGFTHPENFEGLPDVMETLNTKEQVMLAIMEPSLSGLFPKVEKILKDGLKS